jgi:hypothetical protein
MKKIHLIFYIFLINITPLLAQNKLYNCVVLDSLISTIKLKKAQNDFLLPLLKSGEINVRGDSVSIFTKDSLKIQAIRTEFNSIKLEYRTFFLDDILFTMDTLNIIVDTLGFFDDSCNGIKGDHKSYFIIRDRKILNCIKETCNIILIEAISYTSDGALNLFLRNSKSSFVLVFGIRQGNFLYPTISVLGKHLFDPIDGIIIE